MRRVEQRRDYTGKAAEATSTSISDFLTRYRTRSIILGNPGPESHARSGLRMDAFASSSTSQISYSTSTPNHIEPSSLLKQPKMPQVSVIAARFGVKLLSGSDAPFREGMTFSISLPDGRPNFKQQCKNRIVL